jgi:hypothetical protein
MDVSLVASPGPAVAWNAATVADPRLRPTPDYGTLGANPDVQKTAFDDGPIHRTPPQKAEIAQVVHWALFALLVGILVAGWSANRSTFSNSNSRFVTHVGSSGAAVPQISPSDTRALDRLDPQTQAVALLEQAVAHSDGAVEQISARVDRWQGKLQWDPQMATVTTAAINSSDMRVRESGVEIELAAYGLAKNSASLNYVLKTTTSRDHAQKIWALWALGLMANRGVETARVTQVLAGHLRDSDVDSRGWAVEGLALSGSSDAIPLLLTAMHDDPSPAVRERAACGLAQSGMFTHEQRMTAVPQLVSDTDDPALDAQTHGWAFQALGDITGERLPATPTAWHSWYDRQH